MDSHVRESDGYIILRYPEKSKQKFAIENACMMRSMEDALCAVLLRVLLYSIRSGIISNLEYPESVKFGFLQIPHRPAPTAI